MGGCFGNFSEGFLLHGFRAHGVDIFAGAIVVDMIESVRVGEASFGHAEHFGAIVHVVHELLGVEFNAFVVLGEIDASNLYLNTLKVTLYQIFVAWFLEIKHCSHVFW